MKYTTDQQRFSGKVKDSKKLTRLNDMRFWLSALGIISTVLLGFSKSGMLSKVLSSPIRKDGIRSENVKNARNKFADTNLIDDNSGNIFQNSGEINGNINMIDERQYNDFSINTKIDEINFGDLVNDSSSTNSYKYVMNCSYTVNQDCDLGENHEKTQVFSPELGVSADYFFVKKKSIK